MRIKHQSGTRPRTSEMTSAHVALKYAGDASRFFPNASTTPDGGCPASHARMSAGTREERKARSVSAAADARPRSPSMRAARRAAIAAVKYAGRDLRV